MSRRHWIFRMAPARPPLHVSVAEMLAWNGQLALSALATQFGLAVPDVLSAAQPGLADYELAELDRIMRERPKPGRAGKGDLTA